MSRDCEQHRTGQSWDGDWLPRGEREQRWPARAQGASGGTGASRGMAGQGPDTSPAHPARATPGRVSVSHGAAAW